MSVRCLCEPVPTPELESLLAWADEFRALGVRANADTPGDAIRAREAGAEGIGLARTEHMFMGERLAIVQQIILSEDGVDRSAALNGCDACRPKISRGCWKRWTGCP